MRDGNSGARSLGVWLAAGLFLVFAFTAGAASGADNAAWVSYSGVPATMEPGATATVTVKMKNTGTTTWRTTVSTQTDSSTQTTTRTTYLLSALGHGWGSSGLAVSDSVAPNAPRSFRFRITAPTTPGNYIFRWQMARRTIVIERPRPPRSPGTFGAATPSRTIVVAAEPDTAPVFSGGVRNQEWMRGKQITPVALPGATGGNGTLSYRLTCYLPGGVTFSLANKRISGTPRTAWGPTTCTWKVTDADDNTAASDADTLTFTIRARSPILTVSPASLTVAERGSETFTVRPAMQPTGTVTVRVSSADTGVAEVRPASLTFTAANYSTAKTVTVTGVRDDDGLDESTTVRLSAIRGGYNNVSASVAVIVTDDDERALMVSGPSLRVAEGGSGSYTVKLATQPTGPVSVMISGMARGVGVDDSSLSFSTSNWNRAQTVTVSASEDDNAVSETVRLTNTPSGGDYGPVAAKTVKVTAVDNDTRALVVSGPSLRVAEGGSGSYTVKLATQPTGPVSVTISGMARGVGVDDSSLSFSTSNWNRAQTVTVSASEDDNAVSETVRLTNTPSGGDYGPVAAKTVKVTAVDNDTRALVVSGPSLRVAEGGSGSYTVKLATQPTGPVSVTISGMARGVGVDDSSLSFSTSNWNRAQTVTVSASEDDNAVSETVRLTNTPSGGDYGPVAAKTVEVTAVDNDTRALVVSRPSLRVAEGGSGSYTVKLATQPTGPVSVTISGMARGVGVDDSSLSFSTSNWNRAQTVTVSASEDDNAVSETVRLTNTPSGGDYGPVAAKTVEVTAVDNDTRALVVSRPSLRVAEGGSGSYTVKLATQPTGPVSVTISGMARGVGVDDSSLSFSTSNWNRAQTVTVSASEDDNAVSETVRLTNTPSGGDYGPVAAKTVEVTAVDNDTRALVVSRPSLRVAEGGNGTFTVALSTQPTGAVTVSVSSGDTGAATVSPASLSFTAANYGTSQTVTVTGGQDDDAENESATVSLSASGADYDSVSSSVSVTVTDDDTQGLVLSATDLGVSEGGNGTFTVALSTQPTGSVTVSVSSGDAEAATASPASLSFTAATYGTSQTVTVTGAQDDDAENESTTVSLNASGGDYGNVSSSVSVTVTDDDTPGLVLSATDLGVSEGGNGTFTVALATAPTGAVTVSVSSGDTGAATVNPASLTFTAANYSTSQTVTVTGVQDDDAENENTTVSLAASGDGDISASVNVTVDDNESAEADAAPSFGGATIPDQSWVRKTAISPVELPVATGGNGSLSYSLSPSPPAGVTFNALARQLSGTPTERQSATTYTYTVTDADGNTAASDTGTLTFTIAVAGMSADDASFVSYAGVPSTMAAGSSATVTVRMRNTGTTTWTSAAGYALGSQRPQDNVTWGLSRVSLPSDVAPDGTVDFRFTITAPATIKGHKFRWRMIRGASGWFGGKTELRAIAVEADESPSFGDAQIPGQTWVKNTTIASHTLPAATGGNGGLTYSLAGALPAGVTFDASTRILSGTPTAKQASADYTFTATDADGDAASLAFTIAVAAKASDDASFVSYVGVPSAMAAGSTATVTVRMRNTGTTTWTSASGYALGSQRPQDNVTWGLSRVSLASAVAPNGTVDFTFSITAPATIKGHKFRWRMIRGTEEWFGDKTELRDVAVEADESPSFGEETILGRIWAKNVAIDALPLPAATGGNGELTYSLTGTLPAGVTFDPSTRILSGTPTAKQAAVDYTYAATDGDGDAASLSFTIEVAGKARDDASFLSYAGVPSRMAAGSTATVTVRMRNTGTTTWTSAAGYALGSQRPQDNVTWGLSRVSLASDVAPNGTVDFTFAITAPATIKGHKFRWRMIRGTNGWFGDKTELTSIEVEDPSFGDAAVVDQAWVMAEPIDALTLPEASGDGGVLTYSLTPSLPAGVTFTASTRTLAGTPTAVQAATEYTYAATDPGGDAATISFSIAVEAVETDDASFVSSSGVPSKMAAGGTATVTVTMTNTGTTTWTSSAGYALGSQSPQDNDVWGLRRASVSGSVAPSETVVFTFTITAPETTGSHAFAWRMVRDPGAWFGSGTGSLTIEVEDPSFGDATVGDRTWARDAAIDALTLPAASGGDGALTYSLTPSLPAGVTFTASTRTLAGTPTAVQAATDYTYAATDPGGDAATLSFSIAVEAVETDDASFVSSTGVPSKMAAGGTAAVTVTMTNTGTTTWTSSAGYALGSQSPSGNETWGLSRVSLPSDVAPNGTAAFTFTIAAPETTGALTFAWRMVAGSSGSFGAGASATIVVEDPSFGDAAISDQTWVRNTAVAALTLHAASGGDGGLTYALSPSLPDGVSFDATTRVLSGTPSTLQAATEYTYTATDANGDAATLSFTITVNQATSSSSQSSTALPPEPTGVFDMFEYWLLPRGSAVTVRARLRDGRVAPAAGSSWVRSFWRGDLWGRRVALLGDPSGERYDIFEEVEDGLDYWGTFEGAGEGGEDRPSSSLDRPFRWMNRFMAVGDAVESPVTGRLLSNRRRNQESSVEATMRLEVVSHRESFAIPGGNGPAVDGLTFEDVLEVRFWPDVERAEAHDTFYLARGYGAVYSRRSAVAAPGEVVEWWAVEKALTPVVPAPPSVPWFDPFSPGWPKTAVLNGNLEDSANGVEGGWVEGPEAPGWTADSGDAVIARPPSGLAAGAWSMLLRGSDGGGDGAPDTVTTEEWIPVAGGTYQLSACMRRESGGDNVLVDFDDGKGRDADFADAHLVAVSTGTWECRAVTKCIPASVGAVRIRAARSGANLGDAWFDRLELKRIAACAEQPGRPRR